jgi:hypothetical protein
MWCLQLQLQLKLQLVGYIHLPSHLCRWVSKQTRMCDVLASKCAQIQPQPRPPCFTTNFNTAFYFYHQKLERRWYR